MLIKSFFSLLILATSCLAYFQPGRFLTRPVRRNLDGQAQKTRETRHEHQTTYDQGVISIRHAILSDNPRALRRALRQFKDRPSLYVELQLIALDSAKAIEDKDWVFDIVDAVNIADLGQRVNE